MSGKYFLEVSGGFVIHVAEFHVNSLNDFIRVYLNKCLNALLFSKIINHVLTIFSIDCVKCNRMSWTKMTLKNNSFELSMPKKNPGLLRKQ